MSEEMFKWMTEVVVESKTVDVGAVPCQNI